MYKTALIVVSVVSLAACLVVPVLYFLSRVSYSDYKLLLLLGTAGWFVCAAGLAFRKK